MLLSKFNETIHRSLFNTFNNYLTNKMKKVFYRQLHHYKKLLLQLVITTENLILSNNPLFQFKVSVYAWLKIISLVNFFIWIFNLS